MRHAVVMAAGEGSRLRPLDRALAEARAADRRAARDRDAPAGARPRRVRARRSSSPGHLAEQVEELVGDGSAFGLEVRFARQPGVLGSADAVQRGVAAGAEPPFLVTAADTVYSPGDVGAFADAFSGRAPPGRSRCAASHGGRQPVRIRDGLVEKLLDDDASNPLSAAPLWAFGPELVPLLDGLSGPPTRSPTRSSARSPRASRSPESRSARHGT